jgi:hypothetical protein
VGAHWRGKQGGLVKDDMSGDQLTFGGEIEALIPLVIKRVSKEDTSIGARGELMGSSGRGWNGKQSEDPKVCVGGSGIKEGKVR